MTQSVSDHLAEWILSEGPQPIDRVMALALTHPTLGYYTSQSAIGAEGDFITAPEVSQLFGEIVGAWVLHSWIELGEPTNWNLVELGPGRGTLMADIVRVLKLRPGAEKGVSIHLVEASPNMRAEQSKAVRAQTSRPVNWHQTYQHSPQGPSIVIANEFFDALPIRQVCFRNGRWFENCVTIADGATNDNPAFQFVLCPLADNPDINAVPESIYEICPAGQALAREIGLRFLRTPGRALIIDYGYWGPMPGNTFQALRRHRPHPPLSDLGTADLTAHVDFGALTRAAAGAGARVFGPVGQGEFLNRLGIDARAEVLSTQDTGVAAAISRLTAPEEMGTLFKAVCLSSPHIPPPPGFEFEATNQQETP